MNDQTTPAPFDWDKASNAEGYAHAVAGCHPDNMRVRLDISTQHGILTETRSTGHLPASATGSWEDMIAFFRENYWPKGERCMVRFYVTCNGRDKCHGTFYTDTEGQVIPFPGARWW